MPKGEGLYPAPTHQSINNLDAQIWSLQKSTRASIPAITPLHDLLRQKLHWYYKWTAWPASKIVNLVILFIYLAGASWFGWSFFNQAKIVLANSQVVDANSAYGTAFSPSRKVVRTNLGPNGNRVFVLGTTSNIAIDLYYSDNTEAASPTWTDVGDINADTSTTAPNWEATDMVWDTANNNLWIVYGCITVADANTYDLKRRLVTAIGTTPSLGAETDAMAASTTLTYSHPVISIMGDSGTNKVVIFASEHNNGAATGNISMVTITLDGVTTGTVRVLDTAWTANANSGILGVSRMNTDKNVLYYYNGTDMLAARHDDSSDIDVAAGWDSLAGVDTGRTTISADDPTAAGAGSIAGDTDSDTVWFGWLDGAQDIGTCRWSTGTACDATAPAKITNASNVVGPALSTDGTTLYLVYTKNSDASIMVYQTRTFSSGTGDWSGSETTIEDSAETSVTYPSISRNMYDGVIDVVFTTTPNYYIRHAMINTNSAPTLTISQPDGVSDSVSMGATYDITYALSDSDNVVTAAMYYDTDATGLNGVAITGACATAAESPTVTCGWDTTGMTYGDYYVYGITKDGSHVAVSAYSSGVITIHAPQITISGTVWTNEAKTTTIADGRTVHLFVNSTDKSTTTTTTGIYTFNNIVVAANDSVIVYLDGVAEDGSVVTLASNNTTDILNLDIITAHISLEHRNAGPITNADLDDIDAVDAGNEDGISISGGVATFADNFELSIVSGKNYTPGGAVICYDFEAEGTATFAPVANAVTVSGNWEFSPTGTFTTSGTTTFDGIVAQTIITDSDHDFYNLTITNTHASGAILSGNTDIGGDLSISADGASNVLLDAATYNPDVTVAGDVAYVGIGAGSESMSLGSGTWTVTGSINLQNGTLTPGSSTLVMDGTSSSSWAAFGSAPLNGTVNALIVYNGNLVAGGAFTNAGGDPNADCIAQWNGSVWSAFGTTPLTGGPVPIVYDLTIYNGNLVAGGVFLNAGNDANADYIAQWNGSAWSAFGTTPFSDSVNKLTIFNSNLVASGFFLNAGGNANADYIAQWNGSAWSSFGTVPFTAYVEPMVTYGSNLVVGGNFLNAGNDPNADKLAQWNGSVWSAVGSTPINARVYCLTIYNGNLVIGGGFTDAGGVANADDIAQWNGSNWSSFGTPIYDLSVGALLEYNGSLIIGVQNGDINQWDGSSWSTLGGGPLGGTVYDLAIYNENLVVGGSFTYGGFNADYIAYLGENQSLNSNSQSFNNFTHSGAGTVQLVSSGIDVNGIFTNSAGVFDANGQDMTVGGNWTNSATFTPGAGTVTFDKAIGTQTLNSGGTGANKFFNHLSHTGAGTLQLITNSLDVNGDFTNSAGTFDTNSQNISLAGSWSNSGNITMGDSSTITFDSTASGKTIASGGQSFSNVVFNSVGGGWSLSDDAKISGNWTWTAGTFNPGTSTVVFTATAVGKTLTTGGQSFSNIVFDGVGGGWTLQSDLTTTANFSILNGAVTAGSTTLRIGGSWLNQGVFSEGTSSVKMVGVSPTATVDNGNQKFYDFSIGSAPASPGTFDSMSSWTVAGKWHQDSDVNCYNTGSYGAAFSTACLGGYSNYESLSTNNLTSKAFNLAAGAKNLTFYSKGATETNYDYLRVYISTNNGGSFTEAWSKSGTWAWSQFTVDLSAYSNAASMIRFVFTSDVSGTSQGVVVDDVVVPGLAENVNTDTAYSLTRALEVSNNLEIYDGSLDSGANNIKAGTFNQVDGVFTAPGAANTLTVDNNLTVTAGTFNHNSGTVVMNSTTVNWSAFGATPFGTSGYVLALTTYNGNLVAGGVFVDAGGDANADYIAQWNGSAWSAFGTTPLSSNVLALTTYNGNLVAGGGFLDAGGDANADRIAQWNGSAWSAFGTTPLNASVRALTTYNGNLVAGGLFTNAGGDANADYIAQWNGSAWSAFGTTPLNVSVQALITYNSNLVAGGYFVDAGGDANADYIAQWNGSAWSAFGTTPLNASVQALTTYNSNLVVGGYFVDAGGDANADYIAQLGGQKLNINGQSLYNLTHSGAGSLQISTNNLDINGNFTNSAGTFDTNGLDMTVAGNVDLTTGSFTQGTRTMTLDGSGAQSFTAGGTGAGHTPYNIVVANTSGPTNGVTFADSLTLAAGGRLTDTTQDSKMTFADGGTYTIPNIIINGAAGHNILMPSGAGAHGHYHFVVSQASPTVTYVTPTKSDATGSSGPIDDLTGGINGGGNTNWLLPAGPPLDPSDVTLTVDSATQLTANWTDNATDETGYKFYISTVANADCSLATYPGSPNYTTAADATSQALGSLSVNTQYCAKIIATNAEGDSAAAYAAAPKYTLANTPAAPTVAATFSTTIIIFINANSNPASTEFAISCDSDTTFLNYTTNACGAIADTSDYWRTYANWQGVAGFLDVGLSANTNHIYKVIARNGDKTETALSPSASKYTLANLPGAPMVNQVAGQSSQLRIVVGDNGNSSATQFAIQETQQSDGQYLQDPVANQSALGGSATWHTWAEWGSGAGTLATGLAASTQYTFQVKARNGDNMETGFGGTTQQTTVGPSVNAISGSLYDGIGGAKITASKTINVSVNGAAATTAETSGGDFTITASSALAANDIITVYVDGETEKASTVTKVSAAGDLTGIDLFQNYTTIRQEAGISQIINTDLATADNLVDTDTLISVDVSNVATFTQGLYILTGKTYAPGANIKIAGSYNNAGTFTAGTFLTEFNGTSGTPTITTGGTAVGQKFYDLSVTGSRIVNINTNAIEITHDLTVSGATSSFSGNSQTVTVGNDISTTGSARLNYGGGSSTFNIGGNFSFTSTGYFDAGTTTFNFTKAAGTQTITTSGIGANKQFYNLTHSGAGTLSIITNDFEVANNFSQTNGTFNGGSVVNNFFNFSVTVGTYTATSGTTSIFYIAGKNDRGTVFTLDPAVTFNHSDGTFVFTSNYSSLNLGSRTFKNVILQNMLIPTCGGSAALTLTAGFVVGGNLTVDQKGCNNYNLYGSSNPTITVNGNMTVTRSSGGWVGELGSGANKFTIDLYGDLAIDTLNVASSINFKDQTKNQTFTHTSGYVATGPAGAWTVDKGSYSLLAATDWSLGNGVYGANNLTLTSGVINMQNHAWTTTHPSYAGNLVMNGGTFSPGSGAMIVDSITINGGVFNAPTSTLSIFSNYTKTAGTFTHNNGQVIFCSTSAQDINSGGVGAGNTFYNFSHTAAATLRLVTNSLEVDGSFVNSAGTFNTNSLDLTVGGDVNLTTGTFTQGTRTITLDGSAAQSFTAGGTGVGHTPYNIVVANTGGPTNGITFADSLTLATGGRLTDTTQDSNMTFADGATYTIPNITINGSAGHNILMPDGAGAHGHYHFIVSQASPTVTYVTPTNSDATGSSAAINDTTGGADGGGNTNWLFPATPPAAPTVVSLTVDSATQLTANWTDNSSDETGFKVYVSTVPNADCSLATYPGSPDYTTAADAVSQDLGSLSVNTQYCAKIIATNTEGDSAAAYAAAPFYTLANTPAAPTVNNTALTTTLTAIVNQNSNPAGTTYAIQETSTGNYIQADGTLGVSAVWQDYTTWGEASGVTNTGLSANTNYTYQAKARNGDLTATAFGSTASKYTLIQTPTNVTFDTVTDNSIQMHAGGTISNISTGSSGLYFSETSGSSGGGAESFGTWITSNTITDTGLALGLQYSYKVKARNGDGTVTAETSVYNQTTTTSGLTAPSGVGLTADSTTQLTVAWTDNSSDETGFKVYISTVSNADCSLATYPGSPNYTTAANAVTQAATGLSLNSQYCTKVVATTGVVDSAPAYAASPKYTAANAPSAPTVNATSTTSLTVIINVNSNPAATEFAISCDSDTTFLNYTTNACETIANDANHWRTYANWGGGSGFVDTGLSVNTTHNYKVEARNGDNTATVLSSGTAKYTLANTPAAPSLAVMGPTSINIVPDVNGNPASTEFAISCDSDTTFLNYTTNACEAIVDDSDHWRTYTDWVITTGYIDTGLAANSNHSYKVKARNGDKVETGLSGSNSKYTWANTPGAPTVNQVVGQPTQLRVIVGDNGNSAETQFAIQETQQSGGQYLQDPVANQSALGATATWHTLAEWNSATGTTVTGLTGGTQYTFQVKARNGDNTATGFGGTTQQTTVSAANTISGSLYDAVGGSKITTAKTINVSVNGAAATTAESASGDFIVTTSAALAGNDVITIYVSGETEKASTITKVSATGNLSGIDLYQNYTTIRHEGAITEITYSDFDVADNLNDSDELFMYTTYSAILNYNRGVYIPAGETFNPGRQVEVSGSWNNTGIYHDSANGIIFRSSTTGQTIDPGLSTFARLAFMDSGSWSLLNHKVTVTENLYMIGGTLDSVNGSADLEVNGDVRCLSTCGTINLTAGTFTQNVAANKIFGTSVSGTTAWTFNNLTFTKSAGTPTITTSTVGTGDITVNGVLNIAASTTWDAGNRTYHLMGGGKPLLRNGSFVPNTSTMSYENPTSATVVGGDYYNLQTNPASGTPTYTLQAGRTSFLAGTKVKTDGEDKNIEDLKTGDKVLSYDLSVNRPTLSEVTGTTHGTKDAYYNINSKVKATANHVFILSNNSQKKVEDLKIGDLLKTRDGEVAVKTIEKVTQSVDVYDLEVKDFHLFYAEGYLVHNLAASADVQVTNNFTMTGSGHATVDQNANDPTFGVNGQFAMDANQTFQASSTSALSVGGNWTNAGTFTANSGTVTFDKSSGTQTLNSGGVGTGKLFNNFIHSGAGTLQLITNALDVNGVFTNSAGTFDANGLNVNVADDFLGSGGTFLAGGTPGSQTVTFDGTNEATVSGSTTFNNLILDTNVDGAKTIKFTAGSTQTINGTWTLDGAVGKVLTLRSTSDNTAWGFVIPADINPSGDYINVKDSQNNTNAYRITPGANVTNSGNNNPGWLFISAVPTDVTLSVDSATQLTAHWTDNSSDETGFKVYVSTVANADCSLATYPVSPNYTTAANAVSQALSALSVNSQYCAKIIATNTEGDSAAAYAAAAIYTLANTASAPTVENVVGADQTTQLQITINENSNPGSTEFAISCDNDATFLNHISNACQATADWQTKAAWGNTGFVDSELLANTNHTYKVLTRNGDSVETALSSGASLYTYIEAPTLSLSSTTSSSVSMQEAGTLSNIGVTVDAGYKFTAVTSSHTSACLGILLQSDPTTTICTDTGLAADTSYTYKIESFNGNGVKGGEDQGSQTTLSLSAVSVSLNADNTTQMTVNWTQSSNATSYNVYLASGTDCATVTYGSPTIILAPGLAHQFSSLDINSQYCGKVAASDGQNLTTASYSATKYTLANAPSAPTFAANSWTAGEGNSITAILSVNSNPSNTEFAIGCNNTGTSYLDGSDGSCGAISDDSNHWKTNTDWASNNSLKNLPSDTDYTIATNARNGDKVNTTASADSTTVKSAPAQPSGLIHTGITTSSIAWNWNDNAVSPDGYQILDNSDALVDTSATSNFDQGTLGANSQQTIKTRGYRGLITGQPTATSSVYTAIEDPTGISFDTVTASSIIISATGTLSNLNTGSSGVYFTNCNDAWTQTNSCTKNTLTPNNQYSYSAQVRNGDGVTSTAVGPSSKYTLARAPLAPAVTANYSEANSYYLDVAINANSNPVATDYEITFDTDPLGLFTDTLESWTQHTNGDTVTHTSLPLGLTCNQTYYYKIIARNHESVVTSDAVANDTTSACAPSNPTESALNATSAVLNWDAVAGPVATYDVSFGTDALATNLGVNSGVADTFLAKSPLDSATTYYFKTRAANTNGTGAWSAIDNFATLAQASQLLLNLPGQSFNDGTGIVNNISSQVAGTPFNVTVIAVDNGNHKVVASTDNVTLSMPTDSLATCTGNCTNALAAGEKTYQVTFLKTGTNHLINVTGSSGSSTTFAVTPGLTSATLSTVLPQTASVLVDQSVTLAVSLSDIYGNIASNRGISVSSDQLGDIITFSAANTDSNGQINIYISSGLAHASTLTISDEFGVALSSQPQITFTNIATPTMIDNPTNFTATVGNAQTYLSWTNPASSSFGYVEIYRSIVSGALGDSIAQTNLTTYNDTGLINGTTYYYTLKAVDSSGQNSSGTEQLALMPATALDDQPPSAPTNLRATDITNSAIDLAWDRSTDDRGVVGYLIFNAQTGVQIGASVLPNLSLINLSPETIYRFYVIAYDGAGNRSAASEPLSVKTLKGATDTTEPCHNGGGQVAFLVLANAPSEVTAGQAFANVKTMAVDSGGEICEGYRRSVYFESSDEKAELTWNKSNAYTYLQSDAGVHEFAGSGFKFNTPGNQTLTGTDGSASGKAEIKVLGGSEVLVKAQEAVGEFFNNNAPKVNSAAIATTTTLLLAPVLVNLALGLGGVIPQILYWFNQLLQLIGVRKKRKPWGVVFNSQTGQPLSLAMVRIYDKQYNRQLESAVTDKEGRFGFLARPGTFYIIVKKPGFSFPSQFKVSGFYDKIYTSGNISIQSSNEGSIAYNIPVDPQAQASRAFNFSANLIKFNRFLQKIRIPLLLLGMIFAIIMILAAYNIIYVLSLSLYVLIGILEIYNTKKARPYGVVSDVFGHPINMSIVRIYNKKTNRLVETDATDDQGRFKFLVSPGIYYMTAAKPGYLDFKSHIMYLEREGTMVTSNIKLKKVETVK